MARLTMAHEGAEVYATLDSTAFDIRSNPNLGTIEIYNGLGKLVAYTPANARSWRLCTDRFVITDGQDYVLPDGGRHPYTPQYGLDFWNATIS